LQTSIKGLGDPGAFVVSGGDSVQYATLFFAKARKVSFQIGSRDNAPVTAVCLALTLAVFTLARRIAAVW
jgi:hypothetical protein